MTLSRRFSLGLALAALVVGACGDDNKPANNTPATTPTTVQNSAAFTQTDAATGVSISAPAGAYDASAAKPLFTVSKGTSLPTGATLPSGATQGTVYTISKDYTDAFLQPVTVTVPYDPAVNALPVVLHWDAANSKWQATPVQKIDATAKTVTFGSVAFSSFAVMSSSANAGTAVDSGFKPLVDGFQIANFGAYAAPGQSSVAMSTLASWYYTYAKATGGNLYDQSKNNPAGATAAVNIVQKAASAIWTNQWHLTSYGLTPDQTGQLLISTLALTGQPQLFIMKAVAGGQDTDAREVLVYKYAPDCTTATPPVCSTTKGKFYIYNPDFPGEEHTIDWTSGTGAGSGFSNYSKSIYANPFTQFAFDGVPSLATSDQLKQTWQNVNTAGVQNAIVLTAPAPIDATGTYTQTLTGTTIPDVQVTGTAAGNPTTLAFTVNGGPLQTVTPTNGAFNFTLKGTDLKSENSVTFTAGSIRNPYSFTGFKSLLIKFVGTNVAAFQNFGFETGDKTGWTTETHLWDTNSDLPSTDASTVQRNFIGCPFTKARAASHTTYDICDYDAAAATPLPVCGATSKIGDLCYNPDWGTVIAYSKGTFTPEKSAIVGKTTVYANPEGWSDFSSSTPLVFTAGIDPVVDFYQKTGGDKTILGQALNLPVSYNGSWALRVNNEDNNNHASTATQTTTIPQVAAPEIRFAWAAVLEDPGHENSAQPFVDVLVTDDDAKTVLYRKFFYSGNPEYSGWVKLDNNSPTGTRWNVIPWQKVTITGAGIAAAVGHKVTIRVYASDCRFSGHGGYAYLDDAP